MKTLHLLFSAVSLWAVSLSAQDAVRSSESGAGTPPLSADQLGELLAPIALYPDALIALILPAATHPTDIVLAARHLKDNPNDRSQVEHRAWDGSVKSLTHYPEVLRWLDENLTWTKQVGDAFIAQPADVMNAIQSLRAKARASGALINTPQQQVLSEPRVIRIVPADPEIIYVPRYDPAVVFVERPAYYSVPRPLLSFGVGWRVGSWLAYDFDWRRCTLWVGDRHRRWHGRHDWRHPVVPISRVSPGYTHSQPRITRPWQPPARRHRPILTHRLPSHRSPHWPPAAGTLTRSFGRSSGAVAPRIKPGPSHHRTLTAPTPGLNTAGHPSTQLELRHGSSRPLMTVLPPSPRMPTYNHPRSFPSSRHHDHRGNSDAVLSPAPEPRPTATLPILGTISSVRPTVVSPQPARSANPHMSPNARLPSIPRHSTNPHMSRNARMHAMPQHSARPTLASPPQIRTFSTAPAYRTGRTHPAAPAHRVAPAPRSHAPSRSLNAGPAPRVGGHHARSSNAPTMGSRQHSFRRGNR